MKRTFLFLSTLLVGLSMQVRAEIDGGNVDDYKYITSDGIEYQCRHFKDFFSVDDYYAVIYSGEEAQGNVVIPDSIYDSGVSYPVSAIFGRSFMGNEKITRLEIARTVRYVQERAFANCTNLKTVIIPSETPSDLGFYDACFEGCVLDTMVVDRAINRIDLNGASIANLYIQSNDTATVGSQAQMIDKCYLDDIDHLVIDGEPFGKYWYFLQGGKSYYSVKAVSVDAVEPPTIEKRGYSEAQNMNLRWTVLFVPDGSEEKYREAEFWKDFYCIKPMSDMNRYDEFVAEAYATFSGWIKANESGIDSLTEDTDVWSIEGDKLQFTSTAKAEICDIAGRVLHNGTYTGGESLTLPKGVSILTVNDRRVKVAVN